VERPSTEDGVRQGIVASSRVHRPAAQATVDHIPSLVRIDQMRLVPLLFDLLHEFHDGVFTAGGQKTAFLISRERKVHPLTGHDGSSNVDLAAAYLAASG
jgi:hypothetical protein